MSKTVGGAKKDAGGGPWARTLSSVDGSFLPVARWQPLVSHLKAVAATARNFALKIGAADWVGLAGMWHDLGKYHPDFQRMLQEVAEGNVKRRVDHSTAGAIHALRVITPALRKAAGDRRAEYLHLLLTAPIASHHSGLPDGVADLAPRLDDPEKIALYEAVRTQSLPQELLLPPDGRLPSLPIRLRDIDEAERQLRVDLLVRLVLSAVVDADRLDAERFAETELPESLRASRLRASYASVTQLRTALDDYIDKQIAIESGAMTATARRVFAYRQAVLGACRAAADLPPGAFCLDVATGGGKTLSSLSFALRHAERHAKDRVIVVIPFTSIIEQTAAVYRQALGDLGGSVIEHHSAVNEAREPSEEVHAYDPDSERRRLATENWDAPLIVTTAVQFFESLFAATPSRVRKLHNIAKSVVVLDEAQVLPPGLLTPTVWAINELVEGYETTVVLSTATQPALERPFPEVRNLRPIVPAGLEPPPPRVRVEVVGEHAPGWSALAHEIAAHDRVLCITHRRDDARGLTIELDRVLGQVDTIHLSAAMCAAHRSERIAEVRQLLAGGRVCRVVSTQLVEAGVDLDFPVVYRALAGVDSLVQAAGRANREGKLGERGGLLRIYQAPTQPPPGLLSLAKEATETLFEAARRDGREIDIFASTTGRAYFARYYEKIADKDHGITALRREFRFRTVADKYRFIPDAGITIVIPWGETASQALRDLQRLGPSRGRLRRLQPYTVDVHRGALQALVDNGVVMLLLPDQDKPFAGPYLLRRTDLYDNRFGLDVSRFQNTDPQELIA